MPSPREREITKSSHDIVFLILRVSFHDIMQQVLLPTGPPNIVCVDIHSGIITRAKGLSYIRIRLHIAITIRQTKWPTISASSRIIRVSHCNWVTAINETTTPNVCISFQLFVTCLGNILLNENLFSTDLQCNEPELLSDSH